MVSDGAQAPGAEEASSAADDTLRRPVFKLVSPRLKAEVEIFRTKCP